MSHLKVVKANPNTGEVSPAISATGVSAIISAVSLAAAGLSVANTVNVPFDNVIEDDLGQWDTVNDHFVAANDGVYEFKASVVFDQTATASFPTALKYDHQLQVFIDGGFNNFLYIRTDVGDGANTWQEYAAGSQILRLTAGQTIALRVQTRIFPATIVTSELDGGAFLPTGASLTYLGQ